MQHLHAHKTEKQFDLQSVDKWGLSRIGGAWREKEELVISNMMVVNIDEYCKFCITGQENGLSLRAFA